MKYYSRWATNEELEKTLEKVSISDIPKNSGIVLKQDDNNIYIDSSEASTLVVGSTGSGKTQCITMPLIRTSLLKEDSVIVNDVKGEIYKKTSKLFIDKGYDVKVLNISDITKSNCYNPLLLPYTLYKEGKIDKAIELINNISYYIFTEDANADSFWINSSRDYFMGLCLYIFDNNKAEDINLSSIYNLAINLDKLKDISEESNSYIYLNNILKCPEETSGGIIATFNQKLNIYIGKKQLMNMLSNNDIDLEGITKNKTIIYIISGIEEVSKTLVPLFINQVVDSICIYGNTKRRVNIIIDEMSNYTKIFNLSLLINYTRSFNIKYIFLANGYLELINKYGNEEFELIKQSSNIIYLLSKDKTALEDISNMCGKTNDNNDLITIEELKVLEVFEAIILKTRLYPVRINLIPDYKIKWNN